MKNLQFGTLNREQNWHLLYYFKSVRLFRNLMFGILATVLLSLATPTYAGEGSGGGGPRLLAMAKILMENPELLTSEEIDELVGKLDYIRYEDNETIYFDKDVSLDMRYEYITEPDVQEVKLKPYVEGTKFKF